MIRFNKENMQKLVNKGKIVLVAGTLATTMTLTGCIATEVSTNNNVDYDIIDTTNTLALQEGLTQVIDVPGENFKLVIEYKCELQEGERWIVTSDKKLNMQVRTDGIVDESTKVYIDNIHTDTTICSYYPTVNGITQDTMDDRIHNAQMLGFPIADDNSYVGINQIEGQNETFIKGTMHGFNGYSSGTVEEKRRVESDYLEKGVFANKISSIIDLIIVEGDEMRTVSVPSEIQVSVWPFIELVNTDGSAVYHYYYFDTKNNKMRYEELSEDEYLVKTQIQSGKSLTKTKED